MCKKSLATTSLLCHHWLPSSQQYLFRSIDLHWHEPTAVRTVDVGNYHRFDIFRQALDTDSGQHLAGYVQNFTLRGDFFQPAVSSSTLATLFARLPALRYLALSDLTIVHQEDVDTLHFARHPLLELHLLHVRFGFVQPPTRCAIREAGVEKDDNIICSLVDVLNLFTTIRTLRLAQVDSEWDEDEEEADNFEAHVTHVVHATRRKLAVRIERLVNVDLNIVPGRAVVLELLHLALKDIFAYACFHRGDPWASNNLLREVGHTLVDLRLLISSTRWAKGFNYDISACSRLATVHVLLDFGSEQKLVSARRDEAKLVTMLNLIPQLPSTITRVVIDFYHYPSTLASQYEPRWQLADRFLCEARLLSEVAVTFCMAASESLKCSDLLKQLWPGLHSRNLLRVCSKDVDEWSYSDETFQIIHGIMRMW
ncbi:hypothetical protein EIP91_009427 [Steccherinum ochraceum]|uniref:F-box domain-containing protein n=1 Tax=Steccherinum ochraceum TaxID=92696 RepID=A0A4R0REF6_9APHY|nr:hypothetical protein EIP91_009427 [Steccherinum ochraceum]